MAYDPAFPPAHGDLTSEAFRAQFNGLAELVQPGPQGEPGPAGPPGDPGGQGPVGEVSAGQLAGAIGGTSANTNGVATLDTPFADPDLEAVRQKLNELVLAARR